MEPRSTWWVLWCSVSGVASVKTPIEPTAEYKESEEYAQEQAMMTIDEKRAYNDEIAIGRLFDMYAVDSSGKVTEKAGRGPTANETANHVAVTTIKILNFDRFVRALVHAVVIVRGHDVPAGLRVILSSDKWVGRELLDDVPASHKGDMALRIRRAANSFQLVKVLEHMSHNNSPRDGVFSIPAIKRELHGLPGGRWVNEHDLDGMTLEFLACTRTLEDAAMERMRAGLAVIHDAEALVTGPAMDPTVDPPAPRHQTMDVDPATFIAGARRLTPVVELVDGVETDVLREDADGMIPPPIDVHGTPSALATPKTAHVTPQPNMSPVPNAGTGDAVRKSTGSTKTPGSRSQKKSKLSTSSVTPAVEAAPNNSVFTFQSKTLTAAEERQLAVKKEAQNLTVHAQRHKLLREQRHAEAVSEKHKRELERVQGMLAAERKQRADLERQLAEAAKYHVAPEDLSFSSHPNVLRAEKEALQREFIKQVEKKKNSLEADLVHIENMRDLERDQVVVELRDKMQSADLMYRRLQETVKGQSESLKRDAELLAVLRSRVNLLLEDSRFFRDTHEQLMGAIDRGKNKELVETLEAQKHEHEIVMVELTQQLMNEARMEGKRALKSLKEGMPKKKANAVVPEDAEALLREVASAGDVFEMAGGRTLVATFSEEEVEAERRKAFAEAVAEHAKELSKVEERLSEANENFAAQLEQAIGSLREERDAAIAQQSAAEARETQMREETVAMAARLNELATELEQHRAAGSETPAERQRRRRREHRRTSLTGSVSNDASSAAADDVDGGRRHGSEEPLDDGATDPAATPSFTPLNRTSHRRQHGEGSPTFVGLSDDDVGAHPLLDGASEAAPGAGELAADESGNEGGKPDASRQGSPRLPHTDGAESAGDATHTLAEPHPDNDEFDRDEIDDGNRTADAASESDMGGPARRRSSRKIRPGADVEVQTDLFDAGDEEAEEPDASDEDLEWLQQFGKLRNTERVDHIHHEVQEDETIEDIATTYDVALNDLLIANFIATPAMAFEDMDDSQLAGALAEINVAVRGIPSRMLVVPVPHGMADEVLQTVSMASASPPARRAETVLSSDSPGDALTESAERPVAQAEDVRARSLRLRQQNALERSHNQLAVASPTMSKDNADGNVFGSKSPGPGEDLVVVSPQISAVALRTKATALGQTATELRSELQTLRQLVADSFPSAGGSAASGGDAPWAAELVALITSMQPPSASQQQPQQKQQTHDSHPTAPGIAQKRTSSKVLRKPPAAQPEVGTIEQPAHKLPSIQRVATPPAELGEPGPVARHEPSPTESPAPSNLDDFIPVAVPRTPASGVEQDASPAVDQKRPARKQAVDRPIRPRVPLTTQPVVDDELRQLVAKRKAERDAARATNPPDKVLTAARTPMPQTAVDLTERFVLADGNHASSDARTTAFGALKAPRHLKVVEADASLVDDSSAHSASRRKVLVWSHEATASPTAPREMSSSVNVCRTLDGRLIVSGGSPRRGLPPGQALTLNGLGGALLLAERHGRLTIVMAAEDFYGAAARAFVHRAELLAHGTVTTGAKPTSLGRREKSVPDGVAGSPSRAALERSRYNEQRRAETQEVRRAVQERKRLDAERAEIARQERQETLEQRATAAVRMKRRLQEHVKMTREASQRIDRHAGRACLTPPPRLAEAADAAEGTAVSMTPSPGVVKVHAAVGPSPADVRLAARTREATALPPIVASGTGAAAPTPHFPGAVRREIAALAEVDERLRRIREAAARGGESAASTTHEQAQLRRAAQASSPYPGGAPLHPDLADILSSSGPAFAATRSGPHGSSSAPVAGARTWSQPAKARPVHVPPLRRM